MATALQPAPTSGELVCDASVAPSAAGEEPPDSGDEPRRSGLTGKLTVDIASDPGLLAPPAQTWLRDHVVRAAHVLRASGEVRIRLVGDAEMAHAHERHMGVRGTTDVITFDLTDGGAADGAPLDVDLLLCVDEARRQSASRGIELERELLLYAVHGILHCLGHDDHDEESARRMHEREDRTLVALGLTPTYAQGERRLET